MLSYIIRLYNSYSIFPKIYKLLSIPKIYNSRDTIMAQIIRSKKEFDSLNIGDLVSVAGIRGVYAGKKTNKLSSCAYGDPTNLESPVIIYFRLNALKESMIYNLEPKEQSTPGKGVDVQGFMMNRTVNYTDEDFIPYICLLKDAKIYHRQYENTHN